MQVELQRGQKTTSPMCRSVAWSSSSSQRPASAWLSRGASLCSTVALGTSYKWGVKCPHDLPEHALALLVGETAHAAEEGLLAGCVGASQQVQAPLLQLGLAVALQAGSAEKVGAACSMQAALPWQVFKADVAPPYPCLHRRATLSFEIQPLLQR